jgi:hypothetical protein
LTLHGEPLIRFGPVDKLAPTEKDQRISVEKPTKNILTEQISSEAAVWTQYIDVAKNFDANFIEVWEKGLDALLAFVSTPFPMCRAL